ncbi:MAG: MFS transporter [Burkholderiales bacterium]|nr:MFS transporter [Burkholderiales bacterium]
MNPSSSQTSGAWSAVLSITACVAGLITVEFLPAGLLTPMAEGLQISQGMAGQTLTATAFAAIFASLFASRATRGVDRRKVILGYSLLLILSCLLTALSTRFAVLLLGRVLLGLALGGFWAMAAAITLQLVPARDVPKALSIVFGGVSVALVLAAPAGSFLGEIVGWRGVFLLAAGLGLVCLIWQALVFPKLPSREHRPALAAFLVLKRAGVPAAMLAIFAIFAGQFAFFTYLRPFFEAVPHFDVQQISAVLLLFGVANFVGTSLSSFFLRGELKTTLAFAPLLLVVCATVLIAAGHIPLVTTLVVAFWGMVLGVVPVGWSTWVARSLPDDAESAGGLQVAVIQVANTFGAAFGGYLLDANGPQAILMASAILFALSAITVLAAVRVRSSAPESTGDKKQPLNTCEACP